MSFVLVTEPLESGILGGGFIRNSKVVPHLIRLLRNYVDDVIIYVPVDAIRGGVRALSSNLNISLEDAYEQIHKELKEFLVKSNVNKVSLEMLDLIISQALNYDKRLSSLNKWSKILYDKVLGFGPFYILETTKLEQTSYIKNYLDKGHLIGIYSTNENMYFLYSAFKMAISTYADAFLMMQLPIIYDRILTLSVNKALVPKLSSEIFNEFTKSIFVKVAKYGLLKLVLGVSPSVFLSERFQLIIKKFNIKLGVPFPANAVDNRVFKFRRVEGKDTLAVFFARLTPSKGIFELLRAWKIVESELPNAKLRVMGTFGSERYKVEFFRLVKELNLRNVEFLGFIKNRDELYRLVSNAKVLIYPSHEDSYSLTVLEALSLGNAVVAYGIPAIRWVYGGLPNVYIVREGDYVALAKEVIKILKMPEHEYVRLHESEDVKRFLELHGSWENVARAEFNLLRPYIVSSLGKVRR